MRKQTLLGSPYLLSIVIIYIIKAILSYSGIKVSFLSSLTSPLIVSFALVIKLTPNNDKDK